MLRVPAQCRVALGKAVKGSAILCTVILLPWSQLSQILVPDSTYRLLSSLLKRPGGRTQTTGILCNRLQRVCNAAK